MEFQTLLSPFKAGRIEVKNRVVVLPHGAGFVRDGKVGEGEVGYYSNHAQGGVGLIITGGAIVHPTTRVTSAKLLEAYNEQTIESMRTRCDEIHRHGAKIYGQILHLGRETAGQGDFGQAAVAPSAIRSPRDIYAPEALDHETIRDIVKGFGVSAKNMIAGGYDGIEIHGAHGYLVAQFLSPHTNVRSDQYGGSEEKRFRFLREVIDSIRSSIGDDIPLVLRLSADWEVDYGLGVEENIRIAEAVAALGSVDALDLTTGIRGAYVKDMTEPPATTANASKRIRLASGLPVICGQRIADPATAERLLTDGSADLIGMARALMADSDWTNKVASGEADRIRPCMNWNQDCRGGGANLHCSVNPVIGRELDPVFRRLQPTGVSKRIAVIGGGPGGLEASLTAAQRGHSVDLFEASEGLGGQFMYAASVPSRTNLRALIDHMTSEARREGVRINLGHPVNGPDDLPGEFDEILVATGAVAQPVDPELHAAGAVSWMSMMTEGVPQPTGSGNAVFVDDGTGFWWNYGVAEAIIKGGWRLTYVTPAATIGQNIPFESLPPLLSRLATGPADLRVLSMLEAFDGKRATIFQFSAGESVEIDCDLAVVQTGRSIVPGPTAALRAAGYKVSTLGDCIAPRRSSHAIYEAQALARVI